MNRQTNIRAVCMVLLCLALLTGPPLFLLALGAVYSRDNTGWIGLIVGGLGMAAVPLLWRMARRAKSRYEEAHRFLYQEAYRVVTEHNANAHLPPLSQQALEVQVQELIYKLR